MNMKTFVVTFGFGHKDKEHGSLNYCCTRVRAETMKKARMAIEKTRGREWSNVYYEKDGDEMIRRYSLTELQFENIGPQL